MAATAPDINLSSISEAGAAGLEKTFSGRQLTLVLEGYMAGIKNVFIFAIAGAAAAVLVALLIPATRLPAHEEQKTDDDGETMSASIEK